MYNFINVLTNLTIKFFHAPPALYPYSDYWSPFNLKNYLYIYFSLFFFPFSFCFSMSSKDVFVQLPWKRKIPFILCGNMIPAGRLDSTFFGSEEIMFEFVRFLWQCVVHQAHDAVRSRKLEGISILLPR